MSTGVVRSTALRAGGACVRCRKGKTKCVYDNGRAPCKNCAKGMHECYLPSESMAHHHGHTPARHSSAQRAPRESLPASGAVGASDARQPAAGSGHPGSSNRNAQAPPVDKYVQDFFVHCLLPVGPLFGASLCGACRLGCPLGCAPLRACGVKHHTCTYMHAHFKFPNQHSLNPPFLTMRLALFPSI
jgi:hypothetical protein